MWILIVAIFWANSAWAQQPAPSPLPQPAIAGQPNHVAEEPKQQPAPEQHVPVPVPSPPVVKIPERENTQKEAERDSAQAPKEAPETKGWGLADKIAASALVAALLQFGALVVTIGVMMLSTRRQLRAYISILGGSITYVNLIEGGSGLHVNIDFKNFGQTPAYKMSSWIKEPKILESSAIPFTEPTPLEDRMGESITGPTAAFNIHWTLQVTEEDISSLNNGSKKIFVWGGVDFIDAFGRKRHFIFRMTNDGRKILKPGDCFALRPHKLGYDAN